MRRFFGEINGNSMIVNGDEFIHLKTVLRMKEGDEFVGYIGDEFEYVCKIVNMKKDYCVCDILSKHICPALPKKEIILFQALTKREKMEMIVQKAVELGVTKLIPFESEYCVAKDSIGKKDRLEKIVRGACKQCECSRLMEIGETIKFKDIPKLAKDMVVLFANERAGEQFDVNLLKNNDKFAIIVGPEGGFTEKEKEEIINTGAKSINLGKRILRSETASIVMVGMVSVLCEN